MHSNLSAWLEQIEKETLPALPRSMDALARLMQDENSPLPAYATVVSRDPGLTVALLRRVQSTRKRRLTTEITTVEHALMLIGLTQVRLLFPAVPLLDQRVTDEAVRDRLLSIFMRSNEAAFHAREWARRRKDIEPDEVHCAALLHNLGKMLLWQHAPQEMAKIDEMLRSNPEMHSDEAAYVVFGFSFEELTAQLAERWGLPSLLSDSLHTENAQNPRVTSIMLASRLVRAAAHLGWYTAAVTKLIEEVAEHLHMDFDSTTAMVHCTAVEASHNLPCPSALPTASMLLFPSQREAERGQASAAGAAFCLLPQPHLLREALHRLQENEHGGMAVKDVLQLAAEAMHEGIGLTRVVFASLAKDGGSVKARHVICVDQDPKFGRFEFEIREGDLFDHLMRKPQTLWLNDTNREKFAALLPGEFARLVKTESFFALSVFIGDKPLGLFYGDRHHSTCALDATAYHQFKQLGLQAARTLAAAMGK